MSTYLQYQEAPMHTLLTLAGVWLLASIVVNLAIGRLLRGRH